MKSKQEIKSRVYKFYENNKDKGKKYVAAHFMAEGDQKRPYIDTLRVQLLENHLPGKKEAVESPKLIHQRIVPN
jgi:hypothetical protein